MAIAPHLAQTAPADWKAPSFPNGGVAVLASQWANDILPLAQEAHERLSFGSFNLVSSGKFSLKVAGVLNAQRAPEVAGSDDYLSWASGPMERELLKGGFRLAWLLQQTEHSSTTEKSSNQSRNDTIQQRPQAAVVHLER